MTSAHQSQSHIFTLHLGIEVHTLEPKWDFMSCRARSPEEALLGRNVCLITTLLRIRLHRTYLIHAIFRNFELRTRNGLKQSPYIIQPQFQKVCLPILFANYSLENSAKKMYLMFTSSSLLIQIYAYSTFEASHIFYLFYTSWDRGNKQTKKKTVKVVKCLKNMFGTFHRQTIGNK